MAERPPQPTEWAAGGVLHRFDGVQPSYLLVHRPRYDDWSLPKGHAEPGELLIECAIREVEEETGIAPIADTPIGTISYDAGKVRKVVRWWMMEGAGEFVANDEVDDHAWLPFDEAIERISYVNDRNVLRRADRLAADPTAGTVFLIRHGLAGKRSRWEAPDATRPLDDDGRRQAKALRRLLQAFPVTRVVSSPYRRCVQTVAPLAKRLGVDLETDDALAEHQGPEAAIDLIRSLRGESAVLSSHGDIIGGLIGHFAAEGVPIEDALEWKKGSVWILETVDGHPVSARYVPPPY